MAVIRDTVLVSKAPIYIHYTFNSYKELVDAGQRSWEAVSTMKVGSRRSGCIVPDPNAQPDTDEYGFPNLNPELFVDHNSITPRPKKLLKKSLTKNASNTSTQRSKSSALQSGAESIAKNSNISDYLNAKSRDEAIETGELRKRGRPRKFQSEGLPEDISSWTPKQIKHLERSRQAAENYQRKKIAARIEDRVENGEEAADVAYAVLEEVIASRQEENAEAVSTHLISQILHDFAGEPLNPGQANAVSRLRSELAEVTSNITIAYLPSVAAHSSAFAGEPRNAPGLLSSNRRRVGRPKKIDRNSYLPSMAAHTGTAYFQVDSMQNSICSKTSPNRGILAGSDLKTSDKTTKASATHPNDPQPRSLTKGNAHKRSISGLDQEDLKGSPAAKRPKKTHEGYDEAAARIQRSCHGIFIGAVISLPAVATYRLRKARRCQIAVFRLPSLQLKGWFKDEYPPQETEGTVALEQEQSQWQTETNIQIRKDNDIPQEIATQHLISTSQGEATGVNSQADSDSLNLPQDVGQTKTTPSRSDLSPARTSVTQTEKDMPIEISGRESSSELISEPRTPSTSHRVRIETQPEAHSQVLRRTEPSQGSKASQVQRKKQDGQTPSRLYRTGGSTALIRREIIVQLVNRCGGVCPGHKAMVVPFAAEWRARGQTGSPEIATVRNAVQPFLASGELQKIVFSFKTKGGLTATSELLALPDIDTQDPKVKQMQKMVAERYPYNYIPLVAMPEASPEVVKHPIGRGGPLDAAPDSLVDFRVLQQQERDRDVNEKKARVEMARSMARSGPEEKAQFLNSLLSAGLNQDEISRLTHIAHRSRGRRLQSARKTNMRQFAPTMNSLPFSDWLSRGHVSPEGSFEENLDTWPTHPVHDSWTLGRRRQLAIRAAEIERRSAATNHGKDYHHADGDFGPRMLPSPILPAHALHFPRSAVPYRKIKSFATVSGFMNPQIEFHASTGTFSASFAGFSLRTSVARTRAAKRSKGLLKAHTSLSSSERAPSFSFEDESRKSMPLENQVEEVLHWELKNEDARNVKYLGWPFISHQFPHEHETPVSRTVDMDDAYWIVFCEQNGRSETTSMTSLRAMELMRKSEAFTKLNRPKVRRLAQKKNRAEVIHEQAIPDERQRRTKANATLPRTARLSKRSLRQFEEDLFQPQDTAEPSAIDSSGKPTKLRRVRVRGPQGSRYLHPSEEHRLFMAVLVIRVLAGGLGQVTNWSLVAQVFEPEYDFAFIRSKWPSVNVKYKPSRSRVESDFQSLFAGAYGNGEVPSIDYKNLGSYDWRWLVSWAIERLDTAPNKRVPDLPATRQAFDKAYVLSEKSEERDLGLYYELDAWAVSHVRKANLYRHANVYRNWSDGKRQVPDPSAAPGNMSEEDQTAMVRTWIRANTLTPENNYDPRVARAKLLTFPEPIIDAALKSLIQDCVITLKLKDKYKTNPGRNYILNGNAKNRLDRPIPLVNFIQAANFKQELDRLFSPPSATDEEDFSSQERKFRWRATASDGETMALFNLVAHGRVRLVPVSIPAERFGHTGDGYETRRMDKRRLNFEVDVVAVPDRYVFGNPLRPSTLPAAADLPPPLPPPPLPPVSSLSLPPAQPQHQKRSHPPSQPPQLRKLPLWYTIHEEVNHEIWALCLATVSGLLALRSGISAVELGKTLRPALDQWEITLLLDWMVVVGLAREDGVARYSVCEWWWLLGLGFGLDLGVSGEVVGENGEGGGEGEGREEGDGEDKAGEEGEEKAEGEGDGEGADVELVEEPSA